MSEEAISVVLCGEKLWGPAPIDLEGWDVQLYSARAPFKEQNQDAAAVLSFEGGLVLLVADGMGGHQDGERASRLVVHSLSRRIRDAASSGSPIRDAVMDGIEVAHRAVLELGTGAGSTLSAAIVTRDGMRPIHVGDSMILLTGQRGRVKFEAVAHSPTGYAVEAGLLDAAEALVHDDRHLVSNYVGYGDMSIEVGAPSALSRRDTLLVASDGLTDNLTHEEIVDVARCGPLDEAAHTLARRTRRRMQTPEVGKPSKPDDLTFILCRRAQ